MSVTNLATAGRVFRRQGPPPPASPEALAELQARLTGARPAEPPASLAARGEAHRHPAPGDSPAIWAGYYIALGMRPIPIPPGTKAPTLPGWPSLVLPADHWRTHPEQGVGILLEPSGLASLDIDDMEGTRALFAQIGLDLEELTREAVLIQGRKDRLRAWFRLPQGPDLSRKALAWPAREPGGKPLTVFELRAGACQDLAPPSLHPEGHPYTFIRAPWELAKLGGLPDALLELWTGWDRWHPALVQACPWGPPPVEPPAPTRQAPTGGPSVVDAFNQAHDVGELLRAHGYRSRGEGRWIAPSSESGLAGVVLLPSGKVYSHHGADPLADGFSHDAFDVFRLLEHDGDHREAVKAAARLLGLPPPTARAEETAPEPGDWPAPQPLALTSEALPYPLDALPEGIRAPVLEAFDFIKAPLPLVASAALGALSLAAQPLADVQRAEKLAGPSGLYLLTLGDSGERKSTADALFIAPLRDWERAQAQALAPVLKAHQAALTSWESARNGLKERIKGLAKGGRDTGPGDRDLLALEEQKPEPPRLPRLIYQDATPESLAWNLAKGWPCGGILSAEGGAVLGAHGMGKESLTRNLSLLNLLWDAATVTVDRRTSDSFTVRAARVSVSLMIQEATLRDFLEKAGALARGSGFLARFLVAWPESTQGTRFFSPPPEAWPALARFHDRMRALLAQPLPLDEWGDLSPPRLPLTAEAYAAWIAFYDTLEGEMGEGGELRAVRDVASKAADNAARLACLFHLFDHGPTGAIGAEAFDRASRIVAWHLAESRRFFGEIALPVELADASRLDRWLIETARREEVASLSRTHVRRYGPLRDGARLEAALTELSEMDRLRVIREGRRKVILLNPALVEVSP